MKLLFDENLSVRLVALLADEYPGSAHIEAILGRGRIDGDVWDYASAIAELLRSRVTELARFDASGEEALLVIEIAAIRSS